MANTKLLEREIHNLAAARSRRVTIYLAVGGEASSSSIDAVAAAAKRGRRRKRAASSIRCVLSGAGGGGLAFELVYDDATREHDKLAADRAADPARAHRDARAHKLQLVRASDQPPAPLPF